MTYKTYQSAIPDHIRRSALAAFPNTEWEWWHRYQNGKLATVDPARIPSACLVALQALAMAITPEAGFYDFDCYGSGLHYMPTGSSLDQHVDASHHPQKPWRRVSSLVYFLEDCSGGELVVMGEVISPHAGMAVSFESNQNHEVLNVLSERRTISLFAWDIDYGKKKNTSAVFEPRIP